MSEHIAWNPIRRWLIVHPVALSIIAATSGNAMSTARCSYPSIPLTPSLVKDHSIVPTSGKT